MGVRPRRGEAGPAAEGGRAPSFPRRLRRWLFGKPRDLADRNVMRHLSVVGTEFRARIVSETDVAGTAAVVTEVEGTAYRTARHVFELDENDPLGTGFLLR